MPDIGDLMDVDIEELSPEQRQQLQDAVNQFQQKCLLSFKKNRSGVPYLKNDMPRYCCRGKATPRANKRRRNAYRRSGMPRTTS
jgi:hypothetical protein